MLRIKQLFRLRTSGSKVYCIQILDSKVYCEKKLVLLVIEVLSDASNSFLL